MNAYLVCFVFFTTGGLLFAQTEGLWGMTREEVNRRFVGEVKYQSPDGIMLKTQFYGHDAQVYLGFFRDGKVGFIDVNFYTSKENRFRLFREIRRRLESHSGDKFYYTRIDGVDVLGESGGVVHKGKNSNAIVFGTKINGLVYQMDIAGETIDDLLGGRSINLTIDREESVRYMHQK